MGVPVDWYLVVAAVLFTLGMVGVLIRRNAVAMFMSIELMLNAVNLTLVAYADRHGSIDGQVFVFFVLAVAAAEAVVGLAIILAVDRSAADGAVNRAGLGAEITGQMAKLFQTDHLRNYALSFVLGVVFILWYLLVR